MNLEQEIFTLPTADQLKLVELIWDRLADSGEAIAIPDWVEQEGIRRLKELKEQPEFVQNHEQVWRKIERRHE